MSKEIRIFEIDMFRCGMTPIHRLHLRSGLRSVPICTEQRLAV